MDGIRNPFRGLIDHMSEMNRMREYVESGSHPGQEDHRRTHATAWVPTTDIFARGNDLVVRCELAGVRREDVDITISNGSLTVYGERHSELGDVEPTYYTRERSYGQFRRSITLPDGVDESRVKAGFEDGLLEVTIEGGANLPEPRRIKVSDQFSR